MPEFPSYQDPISAAIGRGILGGISGGVTGLGQSLIDAYQSMRGQQPSGNFWPATAGLGITMAAPELRGAGILARAVERPQGLARPRLGSAAGLIR
jgi:hypothetical protein